MPKTALITGGNSGLGAECARQLGEAGYSLILVARRQERLDKVAGDLREKGVTVDTYAMSVSDENAWRYLAQKLKDTNTQLDLVLANAGSVVVSALADVDDMSILKSDIETCLWGGMLTAKYLTPLMPKGGQFCLVSSTFGLLGYPGYSAYTAAKGGLVRLGESLKFEYRHLRVTVACPADIDTPQYQQEMASLPNWMDPKERAKPMSVQDVARLVLKGAAGSGFLILIGSDTRLVYYMKKLLPTRLYYWILGLIAPKVRPK